MTHGRVVGSPSFCGITVAIESAGAVFLRGDANRNWDLDLPDAVLVLRHLFSGETLPCPDAADVDDGGTVTLADALILLRFLYLGGSNPALPVAGNRPSRGLSRMRAGGVAATSWPPSRRAAKNAQSHKPMQSQTLRRPRL